MRWNRHSSYVKNFDYMDFYKKKSCQYFKPIINIFSGAQKNEQLECVIMNQDIIERIQNRILTTNFYDRPAIYSGISSQTTPLYVLNQAGIRKLKHTSAR